jgi:hypothetical protein
MTSRRLSSFLSRRLSSFLSRRLSEFWRAGVACLGPCRLPDGLRARAPRARGARARRHRTHWHRPRAGVRRLAGGPGTAPLPPRRATTVPGSRAVGGTAAGVRPEAGKPQRLGELALLEHSTRVKAVAAQVRARRGEERLTVWRGRGAPSHSLNNKARAPPPRPPRAVCCSFGRSKTRRAGRAAGGVGRAGRGGG